MLKRSNVLAMILAALAAPVYAASAPDVSAVVQVAQPGHSVPKTLYGIFFEDINFAADGGLYAELLANRGFDWPTGGLEGWAKEYRGGGMARLSRQAGFPVHPNTAQYLRIEVYHPGKDNAGVGVANGGFGGIALKQGAIYDLSFYARPHRDYAGGLTVALETKQGQVLAKYRLEPKDWRNQQPRGEDASPLDPDALADWVRYSAELVPSAAAKDARLVVLCDARGTVDLDLVSLFPRDTYKKRKNGLRADLVELLREMKPGAIRFPGGCVVEGVDMATMYDWKRTVGPIERRPVNWNLWNYWQSHGLGYFEYFQLAEDIGAEPLPVLAAGMSCQFRGSEMVPTDGLDHFIENALDLIEFANGAPDSRWGRVRAEMGHPSPFNLKLLGIGNENWDQPFLDRYAVFSKAVKLKYPAIQIVSTAGAGPGGPSYDLAWKTLPKLGADWIDEHYYVDPGWLLHSTSRYDKFERNGPKVYVGEYACHVWNRANSLYAALAEAAMMTGFERNSDVVGMTSYAPLFNKIGSTQWAPDLIWFDNERSFGTPSYHVQKMFMRNLPDCLLPTEVTMAAPPPDPAALAGRVGLGTWSTSAEFRDLSVTRGSEVLYRYNPASLLSDWTKTQDGAWEVVDGALRQSAADKNATVITTGDANWQNYTLRLKARKTGGKEGFLVHVRERAGHYVQVNFGGWNNSQHALQPDGEGPVVQTAGSIEPNRWYDIEISLDGDRITAKLDGRTIFDRVPVPVETGRSIYTVSGLDRKAGEVIVKCVNPYDNPRLMRLTLAGAAVPAQKARRITLTGPAEAVNDLESMARIAPVEDAIAIPGSESSVELKPFSLTILRIKASSK